VAFATTPGSMKFSIYVIKKNFSRGIELRLCTDL